MMTLNVSFKNSKEYGNRSAPGEGRLLISVI